LNSLRLIAEARAAPARTTPKIPAKPTTSDIPPAALLSCRTDQVAKPWPVPGSYSGASGSEPKKRNGDRLPIFPQTTPSRLSI
jgi:hypothetical protein